MAWWEGLFGAANKKRAAEELADRIAAASAWITPSVMAGSIEGLYESARSNAADPSPISSRIRGERGFGFQINEVPINFYATWRANGHLGRGADLEVIGEGYGDLWWIFMSFSANLKTNVSLIKKSTKIGRLSKMALESLKSRNEFFDLDGVKSQLFGQSRK